MSIRTTASLVLAAALLLGGCSGTSEPFDVPPLRDDLPQPENLSWWSRAAMDAYMRFSVWRGERSGYITLFARDGVPIHGAAVGWKDIESGAPMTLDTEVRIASMTKPVTAVAAMILVEEGLLELDDPVAQYLPEFAAPRVATSETPGPDGSFPSRPAEKTLRVRHLLMFASGIGPGATPGSESGTPLLEYWQEHGLYSLEHGDLADRVAVLSKLPLFEEPGTRWRYGWSADVLAVVVEKITGRNIEDFMRERIFRPLGMTSTRYEPDPQDREHMATAYTQDADGELVPAPLHYSTEWNPGGGGLVSTVSDYMRFALMLYNGGEYRGARILRPQTVAEMTRLHVPEGVLADTGVDGIGWGLGMAVVADAEASMTPDRDGDFWWSGYYGTTFVVSPATGLVAVIMQQNEPGEHSGVNYQAYIVQGLAYAGL